MATHHQRRDTQPPPPSVEESYWASLLQEGEPNPHEGENYMTGGYNAVHEEYIEPRYKETQHLGDAQPADPHADWEYLARVFHQDETLELTVIGFNRGGLLVQWQQVRGFVPASQLVDFPPLPNPVLRRKTLFSFIGRSLTLRVIELSEGQNRLILSERAAQARPGERAGILERLHPGDRVSGSITNLCDFGAFIDLGGIEGLIHISELSWGRVSHPGTLLKRGQWVEVCVLEVNKDAGRVALSLKRLHPDPWQTVHHRYAIGQMIRGTITNVVDFGAFVRVEEGLEGLVHVSELAEGQFLHPRNVVAEGQVIQARILSIDGQARRLGLSIRGMNGSS